MKVIDRMSKESREKLAIILLCAFLFGWIGVSITIQVLQVHHYGYGSGIGDGGHLPGSVRAHFGAGPDVTKEQLMKATNR